MSTKKDLEETIKEKVAPLVEETLEKNIGVTIPKLESDIADKLMQPNVDIYIPHDLSFKDAKKMFKREFLKRELRLHMGNISQLAKTLGLDRRSIHRAMKDLDVHRAGMQDKKAYYQHLVDKKIRSTLDDYKEIIHPHKMEKIYQEIPRLSRNIVKFIPHQELSWKAAEKVFEKQFLQHALKESKGNVRQAAEKLEIRAETLHRKIKKLDL
tara:strand:+ start:2546 stop:3178 length:633 start_codon:yes stop_codon:yes gene_type:complete